MDIFSHLENRRCYFCGYPDDGVSGLCADCRNAVVRMSQKKGPLCPVCSQPRISSDLIHCPFCDSDSGISSIYSISYFNSYMKELLILYKSGQMPCLRYFFASVIYNHLRESENLDACIIPVPPRKGKIKARGWDQVDLLCRTLSKVYGIKIVRKLERLDHLQQKTLNFDERTTHMKRVLRLKRDGISLSRYDKVILFDDILTSGATIAAARDLIQQEYRGVLISLVICSVI